MKENKQVHGRLFCLGLLIVPVLVMKFSTGDQAQGSPIAEALWALFYLWAIVNWLKSKTWSSSVVMASLPMIALTVFVLASTFWSVEPLVSERRAIALLGSGLIAFYLAMNVRRSTVIQSFLIASIVLSVISYVLIFCVPSVGLSQIEYVGTWCGVFTHKNRLGMFATWTILCCLYYQTDGMKARQMLQRSAALLAVPLLWGSQSKTSFSIALLSVACYALQRLYSQRRREFWFLVAILSCSITTIMVSVPLSDLTISRGAELLGRDATFSGRTYVWNAALSAIADRPFFGYGYGVFWDPGPDNESHLYFPENLGWTPSEAHNGYLDFAIGTGLCGTGLFLFMIIQAAFQACRSRGMFGNLDNRFYLNSILVFCVFNLFESRIAQYNEIDWILFVYAYFSVVGAKQVSPKPEIIQRRPVNLQLVTNQI